MDAALFAIHSTTNSQKGYSLVQLIFVHDMILPIKHRVGRGLIFQQKQTQINRDNTRNNKNRVDYDYKVLNKFMLNNDTAYKYEISYKSSFVITQCFVFGTVNL